MTEQIPVAQVVVDLDGTGEATHVPASWSVRREITTDVPAQVQASPGAATGSADVALAAPTETPGHFSPLRNRRRRSARPVRIAAGLDGQANTRVFTGQTVSAPGQATDPDLDLSADDPSALLRHPVGLPGLATRMAFGEQFGLSRLWAMDTILRQSGIYGVPPPMPECVLSMPMQDSTWPEVTLPEFASSPFANTTAPSFGPGPRGRALVSGGAGRIPLAHALQGPDIRMLICADVTTSSGTAVVEFVGWGPVTVTFGASTVTLTMAGVSGSVSVPYTPGGPVVLDVQVGPNLRRISRLSPSGGSAASQQSTIATGMDADGLWSGSVTSLGRGISAVQVIDHGTGAASERQAVASAFYGHEPQVDMDPSLGRITAVPPGMEAKPAFAALTEIAEAEFGAIWFDGQGRLTFRNRASLRGIGVTPIQVTSRTNLTDLHWSDDLDSVRSSVEVTAWRPTIHWSRLGIQDIVAYRSDTAWRIPAGRRVRYYVDLDRTVSGIDGPITFVTGTGTPPSAGSWTRVNSIEDGSGASTPDGVAGSVRQVGPARIELTFVGGPYDVWTVDLDGQPSGTVRGGSAAEQPETGRGVVRVDSPHALEFGDANPLVLDPSPWRQDLDDASDQAAWLAGLTATPVPQVTRVEIVPDLSIDLGHIVEIRDPDVTGAWLRALVVGVELSGEAGSLGMTLTVRPLAWTWGDVEAAWPGATWGDMESEWPGLTWGDVEAAPMGSL